MSIVRKMKERYVQAGVFGGFIFLLALCFYASTLHLKDASAGTCLVPHTFTYGEIPTEIQWNDNFAAPMTCINGQLDDTNIAVGASIDQDKLETLNNNSVFTAHVALFNDHNTRHEPNGADEVRDIKIVGSSTLVSLHASRHAAGGLDPLPNGSVSADMLDPGLLSQVGGRLGHNAVTAALTGTSYTLDARPHFTANLSSNNAAVDLVHCAGLLYVAENGATDRVWRIDPVTMTSAAPSSVTLTAGDDPQDIECAPDGSVYVITNNAAAGRALKKITSTGTLSTVTNLTTDSVCSGVPCLADNLARLVIDPNGTFAYIAGSDGTDTQDQQIYRVPLSGAVTVSVHEPDGDPHAFLGDMAIVTRNGVTRLWVLGGENDVGAYCCIYEVNHTATPMTGSPGADCGGANSVITVTTGVPGSCSAFEHDGRILRTAHSASQLWRMGDLQQIGSAPNPTNLTTTEDPRYELFTGNYLAWQTSAALVSILTYEDLNLTADSIIYTGRQCIGGTQPGKECTSSGECTGGGTCTANYQGRLEVTWNIAGDEPCGLTTDGTYLYICADNAGSAPFTVVKHFMD